MDIFIDSYTLREIADELDRLNETTLLSKGYEQVFKVNKNLYVDVECTPDFVRNPFINNELQEVGLSWKVKWK